MLMILPILMPLQENLSQEMFSTGIECSPLETHTYLITDNRWGNVIVVVALDIKLIISHLPGAKNLA